MDGLGTYTYFIFLIFCLNDIDAVIRSPLGALLSMFYQATSDKAGAICLLMFPVISLAFAVQGEWIDLVFVHAPPSEVYWGLAYRYFDNVQSRDLCGCP